MVIKAAVGLVTVAVVQAPARLCMEALVLRRTRSRFPEMFDGRACAATVAACIDEYRRELGGSAR